MIPEAVLDNFQSWMIQVLLIGSIGALLPAGLRVRHPRSQLIYCHLVLLVCLALPVLQSWHHPIVMIDAAHSTPAVGAAGPVVPVKGAQAPIPWESLIITLIISGAIARLCWTLLGLWRIRRHKLEAAPLYPVPESIQNASRLIGTSAAFCVSAGELGPVTFGFLRPVVLLPESLLSMNVAAQCGVACHELLHVKRKDWLITIVEEIVAAALWFHPAVWWLLGQARLSREQLVDAEVVTLISDREPYIDALLTIAGVQTGLDLAPAPLFLRRRHLLQRMHLLVSEVSMSRVRLLSSYTFMAAVLATAAWLAFVSFPLIGHAEIRELAPVAAHEPQPQNPPGYVVNIQPLSYPQEAIDKKIEGTVIVELTFNADGKIIDSHVLSGPDELRQAALESALKGTYSITVARSLQVAVDFKLSNAPRRVISSQGRTVITVTSPAMTGTVESIEISGLADQTLTATNLRQKLQQFQGQELSDDLRLKIRKLVDSELSQIGASSPFGPTITVSSGTAAGRVVLQMSFAGAQTPFGPQGDGTIRTPFGDIQGPPPIQPISKVDPVYPELALQARLQGVVVMAVTINTEGKVEDLNVIAGHPLFIQPAIDAVKQWVYPPQAAPTKTTAYVNFTFPH